MLGDSAVLGGGGGGGGNGEGGGSTDGLAAVAVMGGGGVGSNSGHEERGRMEEGERSFGGNRWPRQETLSLLRIRSDMDVAFRDASVKGPLWEEVSRKMAELGYHRSSKKCKEKFENVYKYHKRTKEGRSGKLDGKTYRFFDQLEALENHPPTSHNNSPNPSSKPPPQSTPPLSSRVAPPTTTTTTVSLPTTTTTSPPPPPQTTTTTTTVPILQVSNNTSLNSVPNIAVPSTTPLPIPMPQGIVTPPSINLTTPSYPPSNFPPPPTTNPTNTTTLPTDTFSNSSSSSTSSDETMEGRRKRKRKWKDFFERLMKEVIEKQEELQKKFLEAIEKRDHDRMVREEAWRVQEMQRINREREILSQERSIATAKDAAVMSFLQKIAEQQNLGQAFVQSQQPQPQPPPVQQPPPVAQTIVQPVVVPPQQQQQQQVTDMEIVKVDTTNNNNGENFTPTSSSRWPKVEVQALIKLRTSLDAKYQENGPKGPLWEEISAAMRKLGYNRNAKRCKEKWENINKYFKKVKESSKKRPEDSKTCPYFHQLDALYREKNKLEVAKLDSTVAPLTVLTPLMVRPEQQWPPQQETMRKVTMGDVEEEEEEEEREGEEEEEDDDDDEEEEEEEDEDGSNYELVANKPTNDVATSVGASAS